MRTRRLTLSGVLLGLALSPVLVACGSVPSSPSEEADAVGSAPSPAEPTSVVRPGTPMPTAVPVPPAGTRFRATATVLSNGEDDPAELCLGMIAASLPPQCGGPELVGFDWADHPGSFEHRGAVRWGLFTADGTFDGTRFTATKVSAAQPGDGQEGPGPDLDTLFRTPCPTPAGGWKVLDPEKTTDESMSATFEAAEKLPGYGEAWVDQTRNPMHGKEPKGLEDELAMNDPALTTINVRVTGDPDAAEQALRKIWGGALCITKAAHTDRELRRIQDEIIELPGFLSGGATRGVVEAQVLYDDGSLQAWADATYGPGLVRVGSALAPVSE